MRIVVCAMAKNEHLYINEWVNHYLKLGFDKIYIYDNDDLDSPYIGDFIEHKSKVEIIDIRGQTGKCLQHKIYNDFYHTHNFEWCLFCDIDEFLMGINSVHLWLEQWYLRKAKQIRVKWRLFNDSNLITRDTSVPVVKSFTQVAKQSLNRNLIDKGTLENQGKAFIRGGLKDIVIESVHFGSIRKRDNVIPSVLPSGKPCWSKIEIKEDYKHETIYLNHYMTKSLSEFINQKLNRNDAVYNQNIKLDYYWRINIRTPEKIEYLKERKLWDLK